MKPYGHMKRFDIQTSAHTELVDITTKIQQLIGEDCVAVIIYVPHTTCALTINEGADPDVQTDAVSQLNKIVPWDQGFKHMEGNSAAHIKAMLVGNSVTVLVEHGKLQLGTWEKIFLCEFDGSRKRSIWIQELR